MTAIWPKRKASLDVISIWRYRMSTVDHIKDATFNQRVVGSIPTALTT
jgi:hypothetical protein